MSIEQEAMQAVEDDAKTYATQGILDKRKLFFRRRVLRLAFRLGFEMGTNGRNLTEAMDFLETVLNVHYPLEG